MRMMTGGSGLAREVFAPDARFAMVGGDADGVAVRHCGINSIELLRDDSGWKVTQISDTRRMEGCPDPLGG